MGRAGRSEASLGRRPGRGGSIPLATLGRCAPGGWHPACSRTPSGMTPLRSRPPSTSVEPGGRIGEADVVLPAADVRHLMLCEDAVRAVGRGRWHVP
jgi:hypothetical protein